MYEELWNITYYLHMGFENAKDLASPDRNFLTMRLIEQKEKEAEAHRNANKVPKKSGRKG